ncbi:MAG: hypothetical protein WCL19_00460 [Verrucomicrobiota bacterium]
MKPVTYLVPLFIDEFQSLHDSGYISVDRSRIVIASAEKGGLSRPEVLCQVAATLPDFMPDAELSVVIACFSSVSSGSSGTNSYEPLEASKACFMAKECSGVIPLTGRSREILSGRFNGEVTLLEPVFDGLVEERFTQRDILNKIQGGEALIEVLIANYNLSDIAKLRNIVDGNNEGVALVQKALGYTRHAPAALEPVSGLRDLRKILRDTLSDPKHLNPPLAKLSVWGDPKWEKVSGFRKIYGDLELIKALDSIDDFWKLPVSAVSLGIFLHWRELSLRVQGIDLKALEADCRELAGILDARFVLEALWMLGFSAGFSSFAGSYYGSLDAPHPFGAKRWSVRKTTLLRLERVPDPKLDLPADNETTHQSSGQEDKRTAPEPEQFAAEDLNSETNSPDSELKECVEFAPPSECGEPEAAAILTSSLPIDKTDQMPSPESMPPASPNETAAKPERPDPSPAQPAPATRKLATRKKSSQKTPDESPVESGDGELFSGNPDNAPS